MRNLKQIAVSSSISRLIKYFLVTGSSNKAQHRCVTHFSSWLSIGQRGISLHYHISLLAMAVLFLSACNDSPKHAPRSIEPAFYYWKSTYNPSPYENARMDSLNIKTLYLKFFDVDWDDVRHLPVPQAIIRLREKPAATIIPVVFITNESLQQMDSSKTGWLADKMVTLIKAILQKDSLALPAELQIDCDWSASTKDKYFALLKSIKQLLPGITLSATIRLYQTKYFDKAGVPPVDRGLLMCYNMGNLKKIDAGNSIIETAELKKYIGNLGDYPLPLDVALPIFNWKVWFRKGQYEGITEEMPDEVLQSMAFTKNGNNYTAVVDMNVGGYEFKEGDVLRRENSDADVVLQCAKIVSDKLKNTRCRVSLYHLDSVLLSKYSTNELESMYNSLR
jgi:hypothetical protein